MSQYADFVAQIDSLPELVRTESRQIDDRMRLLLTTPEIYGIRQVILTGSGDSYFAAQAVAPAIRAWTGLPVSAMLAMEASRYLGAGVQPPSVLVVAISSSGEAARVIEATRRLRAAGALTIGVTANAESRLGLSAERVLGIAIPGAAPAPGTRSYVAALLAGYALGIRLAEVRMTMTMDEANALRAEIAGLAAALAEASRVSAEPLATLAAAWQEFRTVDVLGSGPALASAGYGAAKLVEAAGLHATAEDAEEFHHLNYFVSAPETIPTIVLAAPQSLAASRVRELLTALEGLGRPTVLLTGPDAPPGYGTWLELPAVREWFSPLLHTVPTAHLAAAWSHLLSATHYRGHAGPWHQAQGAGLVRGSAIEV